MSKNILIVAGESSGDIHASNLVKNLKKLDPEIRFFGIGGKNMSREGVEILKGIENMAIIGVWEIFSKIPHIREAFAKIRSKISASPPDAAILVDYPGFNLRLARALKRKGIPVIYYITPQVWAWGAFRIRGIKKYVDKAIVILPFEEKLFRRRGIDATFVGHPILETLRESAISRSSLGLVEKTPTVAILPGSREREVRSMLGLMCEACGILAGNLSAQFVLLRTSSVDDSLYDEILKGTKLNIKSVKDDTRGVLGISDFVLTASGTATLEAAVMEKPMLIIYKTSFLTALLFKIFARTPFIGLVNIIAGRGVCPEVLQYDAGPRHLANEMLGILSSEDKRKRQIEGLRGVKKLLGPPGASERAAGIALQFISRQR